MGVIYFDFTLDISSQFKLLFLGKQSNYKYYKYQLNTDYSRVFKI